MSANANSAIRGMDLSASPLKRSASQTFETSHDEQQGDMHEARGLSRNPTSPARFIKKPQPKLLYSETMVRDAMRGELVYTPDLKPMMDSIARDMRSTKQTVGRHLGSNIHYSKMKSILKQDQTSMITLDRYLLSEAFIRTDIWNTKALQEFFELVHSYGLEREFRDEYWEKNQLSHPANIQKLYGSIKRPLVHPAFDEKLADQITIMAKDIMSRSVYVPRADHPIIRSAVAIMNVAEQQPKDDISAWDKYQEGPKRVAQIWAAWCLTRDKDWLESTYLAAIILERGAKNQTVAKCFHRENSALLRLVDKGYDKEACRRWQDKHGKCHIITLSELLSRPVVASLPRVSSSSPGLRMQKTFSSTSQLQKNSRMAKKTGTNLAKVVPFKVKKLDSPSHHQLASTRSTPSPRSRAIPRSGDIDSISRDRAPEGIVRDLRIHDNSSPKKGHMNAMKRRPSENFEKPNHPEVDRLQIKKRKTTNSFSPAASPIQAQPDIRHGTSPTPSPTTPIAPVTLTGSITPFAAAALSPVHVPSTAPLDMAPIPVATMSAPDPVAPMSTSIPVATMSAPPPTPTDPTSQWMNQPVSTAEIANMVAMKLCSGPSGLSFTGQPVVAKTEDESLEETWTKLEARLETKLSPCFRQLDSLSSDIKALRDKQTALEQAVAQHADGQRKYQDAKRSADDMTRMIANNLTKLVVDQQIASKQQVVKMDDQFIAVIERQTTFEKTITEKIDSLSQLVQTLQKDQEELKSRASRGQKKRGRSSANDKAADSITCAPWE
ncbi:hypothetical protein CSUB01_08971 [Colletotrichum sublineola]|uniref:Uncharacterized protein n=1 Tax=Colletotrichum sublineola TaxID=1173701 RepID=A0A066XMG0_COLSU|nr:hypothetical protein CSUB01_08971 [Colletotrichum sublineola]